MEHFNTAVAENSQCRCIFRCCPLQGCCMLHPLKTTPDHSAIQPYQAAVPLGVTSGKLNENKTSFLDLPAELRNRIYRTLLIFPEPLRLSLHASLPTRHRPHRDRWGKSNRLALLSVCRQLYHETIGIFYSENVFEIHRGIERDWSIPPAPGMPFHLIRNIGLLYPQLFGPPIWDMQHTWSHLLNDSQEVTSKFRNLFALCVVLQYVDAPGFGAFFGGGRSWDPMLIREPGSLPNEHVEKVARVIRSLNQMFGRSLPACVQLGIEGDWRFMRPGHEVRAVGHGLWETRPQRHG